MAIKKVQPVKPSNRIKEVVEVPVMETPEEAAGNSVPTWEPPTGSPEMFVQNEDHNLPTPFNPNDPAR